MVVEEQRIEVQGLSTRYRAAGEGPPLLLLHGVGENALDWQWVTPELARLSGLCAGSTGLRRKRQAPADYSPAFFARFASAFLDALGADRVMVVGNLLGGLIALRLALAEPERVTALGLVSSAGLG